MEEKYCEMCGCPIRDALDSESCWCGVEITLKEDDD